jgi:hypothetical protein
MSVESIARNYLLILNTNQTEFQLFSIISILTCNISLPNATNGKTTKMETQKEVNTQSPSIFNKMAYGAFIVLALYYLVFNKSYTDFMTQFGIALVFDPFDQAIKWGDRPLYQRIWLLLHVAILFGVAIWFFFLK